MGPSVRGVPDMQYLAAQGAMRGAAYADGEQPKKAARKRKNAPKVNRQRMGYSDDPKDECFETLRFTDSLRSQYNNAIRHFVAYVKSNGLDPEQAVDTVTDSVFRNCLKWMQKNLEAQFSKLKLPTPKAYLAQRAISNARDAELYRKLNAEQRHEAPPQASTKFTV
ncbi:hypothetical protein JL720_12873 [Aureococcus anophagefferens]|nr:hypothetical protein JL720_12873 [Aureococcus anophagefferens]